ncbi:hypothetical protein [uncultured Cloacibacillus sp.]|uniref:hypothetical protein n=1 Tax=uncultured Cloacibacillus sp. TaxID=889794 RepID=UPI0026DB3B60|nr:hypothetical protein [uncultured Cloacibacillus sp.]
MLTSCRSANICLISVRNLSYITPLNKYIMLSNGNIDIIYWNRTGATDKCSAGNVYEYNYTLKDRDCKIKKIMGYWGFRQFALKILKHNRYKKIIVLPTQTALILYDYIIFTTKCRYMLSIRDYTYEHNKIFAYFINKLIQKASIVTLTSPAFKQFLPEGDYIIDHNYEPFNKNLISLYREQKKQKDYQRPIVISCVGGIRFIDEFSKMIRVFANDKRFILRFDGLGSENLQPLCEKLKCNNIILTGRFERRQTVAIAMKGDIANNYFGNSNPLLIYALSNRLYNAAQLGMPIIVCDHTYMAEIIRKYQIGFVLNLDDNTSVDSLYNWYMNLNMQSLYTACDKFIDDVLVDEQLYKDKVGAWMIA